MFIVKIDSKFNMSEADLEALDEVSEATTIGQAGEQTVHNLTVELDDSISQVFNTGSSHPLHIRRGNPRYHCLRTASTERDEMDYPEP